MQTIVSIDTPEPAGLRLAYTDHAMLIIWGQFARQIGLLSGLMDVPIAQKTVDHRPQTKLMQLLVAMLAGCAHLQDMSAGSHPLVKDQAVADAWGQPAWADPSGVSRTFRAADAQTVTATLSVLQQVSQPFIDREVVLSLLKHGSLLYDADLTGREVSETSQNYPGVAFGWMGDHIGLGYQAGVVSLRSPTYGRLLLTSKRHPGNTASAECLEELVRAAEAATGVSPRRWTDLVVQRLEGITKARDCQRLQEARAAVRVEAGQRAVAEMAVILPERKQYLDQLLDPQHPDGSTRRVADAQRRYQAAIDTLQRRQREAERAAAWWHKQQGLLGELEAEHARLTTHLAELKRDNATNPAPIRAIFRVDAGFGSGPNMAWLIEMGYEVYSKAHNAQVTADLRMRKPEEEPWARVGKNAEVWVQSEEMVANCPYPLDVALERFQTGETVRYATLLHTGTDPVASSPATWFHEYNGRQTIEAGIKENKSVFQMRHLKLRSSAGLAVAEGFALFAANFVRWAAVAMDQQASDMPTPFACHGPRVPVKQLVCTAANTPAWVVQQPGRGVVVAFTDRSPFAGVQLAVGCNGCFQPPLPLFKSVHFSPPEMISS